ALRTKPAPWAKTLGTLPYRSSLVRLGEVGGWVKARDRRGREGYVHLSALTEREVTLKKRGTSSGVTANEDVALAGKGFSAEVEREYAASSGLPFREVDRMERVLVSSSEMVQFIEGGKLQHPE